MEGPIVILGLGCNLLASSLISAVILLAACSLWNKWFGNKHPGSTGYSAAPPVDGSFGDESNPFSARDLGVPERMVATDGITEPDFGHAYVTCFLASFANLAISFLARMATGVLAGDAPGVMLALQLALIPVMFLVNTFVYKARLETTFPRAMAITGLTLLIAVMILAVVAAIVGVVIVVMALAAFVPLAMSPSALACYPSVSEVITPVRSV